MSPASEILDFWFGAQHSPDYGKPREFWFRKSAATDELIRSRFGPDVEAALRGEREEWTAAPRSALALILLLDQFTRNIFRDTPRAFEGDPMALAMAKQLVVTQQHSQLAPIERWFAYMPFEHSESLADQREALRLFQALEREGLSDLLPWAQKHYDVIARFGRFPHRNAILGRESTEEELVFLQQPGARL